LFFHERLHDCQYSLAGLLVLQYCIGIGSIGNTFKNIARVLQYILKICIGIGIANTFFKILVTYLYQYQ